MLTIKSYVTISTYVYVFVLDSWTAAHFTFHITQNNKAHNSKYTPNGY